MTEKERMAEICTRRTKEWDVEDLLYDGRHDLRRVLGDETLRMDQIGNFSESDMQVALDRFRELQTRLRGRLSKELMESYSLLAQVSHELQDVAECMRNLPQASHELRETLILYSKASEAKKTGSFVDFLSQNEMVVETETEARRSERQRIQALRAEGKLFDATDALRCSSNLSEVEKETIRAELGKDLLDSAQNTVPQDLSFFHDCIRTLSEKLGYGEIAIRCFIDFHDKRLQKSLEEHEQPSNNVKEQHDVALLELIDTYYSTISDAAAFFEDAFSSAGKKKRILAPFLTWIRGDASIAFQGKLDGFVTASDLPPSQIELILKSFSQEFAGRFGIPLQKLSVS